ncbi:MAG: ABC transporter ATP-binding protein, partial [Anaerolineae bacterium]|nr:ABC transporter ATP-binding protein [Anaerolineae bacterium]
AGNGRPAKTSRVDPARPDGKIEQEVCVGDQLEPEVLRVRNLSVDFVTPGQPPAHALDQVGFSLRQGEILGVVGESGCGKSTLMLGLMRLLAANGRITAGQVLFQGQDLLDLTEEEMAEVRWKRISIIFQGAMNALNPVRRVGDQIAEAIWRHYPTNDKSIVDQRVGELFEMVGISAGRKDEYPHQFSGGMRQRAMIAMALACTPQIVIADEPTTALDVMVQAQILELIAELSQKLGVAVLFVTHDLGVVAEICDTVLVMYGGVVAEYAPVDTIFNNPQHPYTQELLKAFPDISRLNGRLASIPGYPPPLDALPPGCRFAPRCPAAFERCYTEQPPSYPLGSRQTHQVSCFLVDPP